MDKRELLIEYFKKLGYKHIEDDSYNIAKRVKKYDKELVLLFNPKMERYEVHTCAFFPSSRPTYCVGCNHLDYELIHRLKEADNRTEYGFREKMDEIEQARIKAELSKEKRENDLRDYFVGNIKREDSKGTRHFYMGR